MLESVAKARRDTAFAYLYGLALIDSGERERGLREWEAALKLAPGDRNLLLALAAEYNKAGLHERARQYWGRLAAINPRDPALMPAH